MTLTGARILVVDDDPGLLDLIEMRLAANGYAVSCAASGAEALVRFRAERPRVVISDLRMEGMDGHALFSCLHAEAPSVPVIMLTAHGTIPDA
ncbi:MAG: response regulator, partial [Rhodocyclales bacterium]|nr:response regulator [Rhodocyclales bacterium]